MSDGLELESYPTKKGAVVVLVIAALLIASLGYLLLSNGSDAKKPKAAAPLTITQKAGLALTRDFNAAYKGQGLAITRVISCEQNPKKRTEFACAAAVSNGTATEACGGFLFLYVNGATRPETIQKLDAKYCP